MDRTTGRPLEGLAHLRQSVADILTTPLGTRLMRRDYGSRFLDLIDAPANATTRVQLYAAAATALMRWEPRIVLQRVALSAVAGKPGAWVLDLAGWRSESASAVSLRVPLDSGAGPA